MFKKIWKIDATPVQLICSIIISLYVMIFISVFVGSMGGVPAFLGFLATYYLLRNYVMAQGTITDNYEKNLKQLLEYYGLFYLVIWSVVKIGIFIAKAAGWGNVKDLTFGEYFLNLYGSTLLEKWAYVFAGILMYSFVISLFPIIIIKARRLWIKYLIFDTALFSVICFAIAFVSRRYIDNELEGNAVCVLDDLLLCEMPQIWQAILYIIAIIAIFAGTVIWVYRFSLREILKEKNQTTDQYVLGIKFSRQNKIILLIISVILIVSIGMVFFMPENRTTRYRKIAEFVTEDEVFGPMIYGANMYIPVADELSYYETGIPLGYIGFKEQNCDSRFYRLTINNILYCPVSRNYSRLQMYGRDVNSFKKVELIESENLWKEDEVFILWDEDWENESTYATEITGFSQCEREFVEALEEQFGVVEYSVSDFKDYDAYFTISSYSDMKSVIESEKPHGNWVGCILARDNEFYYGNYENQITGSLREQLLDVLGGN